MAEKLVQHKHCKNCGKAVLADRKFCGDRCNDQYVTMMKKKRNQYYLLFGILMAVLILSTLYSG